MWRITGADVNAAIPLGQKATAEVPESAVNEAPGNLTVPSISISIYEFQKR